MCGWICVFCSSVCSSATDWSLEPSSHSDLTPLCARPTLLPLFPGLTENQGIVLSDIFFENDLFKVLLIGHHPITFFPLCCHFSQGWSRFSWPGINFIFRHTQLQRYLSYWVWLRRANSKLSSLWFVRFFCAPDRRSVNYLKIHLFFKNYLFQGHHPITFVATCNTESLFC